MPFDTVTRLWPQVSFLQSIFGGIEEEDAVAGAATLKPSESVSRWGGQVPSAPSTHPRTGCHTCTPSKCRSLE